MCNLPDEGRESVLWVDDVDSWVVGAKGVAVAVSPEPLNGYQIFNSIKLAIDDKKEIHVTSRDNKAILIIYTPPE